MLVIADVATSLAYGLAPFAAGIALDVASAAGADPMAADRVLFVACAGAMLLAPLPLRSLR
jgi:hypothetical protein